MHRAGRRDPRYLFVPCPSAQKTQELGISVVCFPCSGQEQKDAEKLQKMLMAQALEGRTPGTSLEEGMTDKFILYSREKGGGEQNHSL